MFSLSSPGYLLFPQPISRQPHVLPRQPSRTCSGVPQYIKVQKAHPFFSSHQPQNTPKLNYPQCQCPSNYCFLSSHLIVKPLKRVVSMYCFYFCPAYSLTSAIHPSIHPSSHPSIPSLPSSQPSVLLSIYPFLPPFLRSIHLFFNPLPSSLLPLLLEIYVSIDIDACYVLGTALGTGNTVLKAVSVAEVLLTWWDIMWKV